MKRLLILSAALLTVLGARSQNSECKFENCAVVTGEYEKEYDPDEIYVIILIRERDSKGKISIEEQQHAMIKALKECGIDISHNLRIIDISTSYYKKGQNFTLGRYELKFSSVKDFYTAYEALDGLDLSDISISRTGHSNKRQLEMEVCAEAMRNARRKAKMIAEADGLNIGKCIYFSSSTHSQSPNSFVKRVSGFSVGYTASSAQPEPDYSYPTVGTFKISATVEARFQLE